MFASWLFGVAYGAAMVAIVLVAAVSANPVLLALVAAQAILLVFAAYGFAYIVARTALAGPVAAIIPVGTGPNPIPDNPTELSARAFSVGLTAALNTACAPALVGVLVPALGALVTPILAPWAFLVTSFAAIPSVSRNRLYQGILGWSGWIFPMSLMASAVGFLWFAINFPFALVSGLAGGGWPFRIDWSTGAIETVGGITGLISTGTALAGTVGHFVFILRTPTGINATFGMNPAIFQQPFVVAGPPAITNVTAHETGHTLDYTAFGGFRVLFALIDQVILGNSFNAYTELTAESHVRNPGRMQVRVWS